MKIPAESAAVPPNAVGPKEWAIFASRRYDAEDRGGGYEKFIHVFLPNGSIFQEQSLKFSGDPEKAYYQVIFRPVGFLIDQEGKCEIKAADRREGKVLSDPEAIRIRLKHESG